MQIYEVVLRRGRDGQMKSGSAIVAVFMSSFFSLYILQTFRDKAKTIILQHVFHYMAFH